MLRGIDPVQLSVIRFDGKEIISHVNHAIPRAVRLKIRRVRMKHRMSLLELTQVGHNGPVPAMRDTNDGIGDARNTMRAAGAGKHGIQGIPDELNISHSAHKATAPGTGLT